MNEQNIQKIVQNAKTHKNANKTSDTRISEEDKIKCAFEELMVLTAERYIFVEGKDKLPIRFAKIKMLKNMITSTTSGWFNLFLKINFVPK